MKTMKRKLCAILCAAMLAGVLVPTASAATFSDVSDHWAASYIQKCADLGIVDGVGGGKFDPEGTVSNAAFVKMLCAAFFADEEKAYENENRTAINADFADEIQWYSYTSYYFRAVGLLSGVDYQILTPVNANTAMSRNNMAQVAANVLARKGIGVNDADLNEAQAKMPDYNTIPEEYCKAVKICYALGVITGTDGGRFDGESTMTRAQACAVITRLLGVMEQGNTAEIAVKDIVVTNKAWSGRTSDGPTSGTAWYIEDNGFPTGYLNNGKPITEENVLELLGEAEKIWPDGMIWDSQGDNNNFYGNSGSVSSLMQKTQATGTVINNSTNFACGGFAAMICDYLFGRDGNPAHRVTDMTKIRPGDVILHVDKDANRILHASISISSAVTRVSPQGKEYPGCVWTADGNSSGKVDWPDELEYKYGAPLNQDQVFVGHNVYWIVWSRYPE